MSRLQLPDRGVPWSETPKVFHFRSDLKNIAVLKAAELNAVSLANNHTLDFGYEAMFEMLTLLDKHAIAHAGAGENAEKASGVAVIGKKGKKVGMIAFTDNDPEWEASDEKAGVFYIPIGVQDRRVQKLFRIVYQVKETLWHFLCLNGPLGVAHCENTSRCRNIKKESALFRGTGD